MLEIYQQNNVTLSLYTEWSEGYYEGSPSLLSLLAQDLGILRYCFDFTKCRLNNEPGRTKVFTAYWKWGFLILRVDF